jgi:hypothetical protein
MTSSLLEQKIKTARQEGGLFWLTDTLCQRTCRLIPSSKQKAPNLLGEVGFGRRVRGNANGLNILGWILLRLQNVSIPNLLQNSHHEGHEVSQRKKINRCVPSYPYAVNLFSPLLRYTRVRS